MSEANASNTRSSDCLHVRSTTNSADTSTTKETKETTASLRKQLGSMIKLCDAQREKIERLQRDLERLRRQAGGGAK